MVFIVLFLSFFVFIFVGSPIALALGGSALIYIVLFANVSPLIVMQQILASVNTYTLLAVPFFIMAGALMETGGISKRIVSFCQALVGHFTGGLAPVSYTHLDVYKRQPQLCRCAGYCQRCDGCHRQEVRGNPAMGLSGLRHLAPGGCRNRGPDRGAPVECGKQGDAGQPG